jgi:hypothetical protein
MFDIVPTAPCHARHQTPPRATKNATRPRRRGCSGCEASPPQPQPRARTAAVERAIIDANSDGKSPQAPRCATGDGTHRHTRAPPTDNSQPRTFRRCLPRWRARTSTTETKKPSSMQQIRCAGEAAARHASWTQ